MAMKNPKKITELKRPTFRHVGKLYFCFADDGVWLRGKHKQTWQGPLSWAEIASLLADRAPLLDEPIGAAMLEKMGAS